MRLIGTPPQGGLVGVVPGPAGPAGPTGPTGATGPAGPTDWDLLTDKPVVIAAGATAADARTAIDAPSTTALFGTGARSLAVKSKSLGGNITVKPGYDWRQLWSEWDWEYWIKPQVDRAIKLGLRGIRLIGAPRLLTDAAVSYPTWVASTAYVMDKIAVLGGRAYRVTTAGTSASSGGPTGTGSTITDGSVTWEYVRPDDLTPLTQTQYDTRWAQLAQYCASNGLDLYPCLCQYQDFDSIGSGQFQNATLTTSIVTTAAALSAFPNVIGFDIFQEGDPRTGIAWAASRAFVINAYTNNGGKSYKATTGGTAASSGGGPTGTGTGIADGSIVWDYAGVPLFKADVLALLAAIRAVSNVPITMSFSNFSFGASWSDIFNLWYLCLADPSGLDFIDCHVYSSTMMPSDLDFLSTTLGKPIMYGEFGTEQTQTSGAQTARYTTMLPLHSRQGVIGSYVWALADQGRDPSRQAGVWDNTGWAQGASPAPLSTTSGVRTDLAAVLRQLAIGQPPEPWQPPNIVTPARARPPRSSVHPGGQAGWWNVDTNTIFVSDGRGLGVKCVAGGSTTGIFLNSQTILSPPLVASNTWYRMVVEVVADSVGRYFDFYVDWYNGASFVATTDRFRSADAVNMPTRLECLVKSDSIATRCNPVIKWSADQATNEVHILRSFRIEAA